MKKKVEKVYLKIQNIFKAICIKKEHEQNSIKFNFSRAKSVLNLLKQI